MKSYCKEFLLWRFFHLIFFFKRPFSPPTYDQLINDGSVLLVVLVIHGSQTLEMNPVLMPYSCDAS